jgi:outer membrane receptor protein involved in Fe transport
LRKLRSKTATATLALLLFAGITPARAQPAAEFAFDLPAESLSMALRDVAVRTGRNVIAPNELVQNRKAPPLAGTFTAEEAVAWLLAGTGLRYRLVDGTLVVERSPFTEEAVASGSSEPAEAAITVTGTRIRGAGSASPVTVTTRRQLEQAGINDLADFTRVLPQNYAGGQNRGIAGGGEQGGQQNLNNSATLNLRGLGPDATLTLLDGHRVAYDALDQGIDVSAIPLGAIDRIEVVADGASALYGSDAVAGVANIILRRDYDGLETTVRAGGSTDGGNFQKQLSLVGGQRWATGGFMMALDSSSATPIYAGQRDYARTVDPSLTLTDRNRQLSGVVSAHQRITPWLSFELDGYAMDRRALLQNPFLPESDVHVNGLVSRPHVRSFALTPTLRADLGSWQTALSVTGARSRTFLEVGNYSNGVSRNLHNQFVDGLSGLELAAEGPLINLPGGAARLALGGGQRHVSLHLREAFVNSGQEQVFAEFRQSRNVQFAYGELSLPLVGPDQHVSLVDRLAATAALRYERWSGLSGVTTPKLGLIYQPTPDVTVRATWGKSFKVPTLDQINEVEEADLIPGFYFTPPPQLAGAPVLLLLGSAPDLRPERANTWSATLDARPHVVPGLHLQATYFHVGYRDRIAAPIISVLSALYNPLYSDLIVYNPTAADVNAAIADAPGGLVNQTGNPFDPGGIGAIIDASIRNTARQRIHGVDLAGDYRLDSVAGGTLLITGAASYLASNQQLTADQPIVQLAGTIFHPPHWRGRGGAVWNREQVSLSAFVNYIGSTTDNRFTPARGVGSFVTLDLNGSFRTKATDGPFRNMELRISALNILDEKPSPIRTGSLGGAPYDSTNQSPVGRFLGVALRKTW